MPEPMFLGERTTSISEPFDNTKMRLIVHRILTFGDRTVLFFETNEECATNADWTEDLLVKWGDKDVDELELEKKAYGTERYGDAHTFEMYSSTYAGTTPTCWHWKPCALYLSRKRP